MSAPVVAGADGALPDLSGRLCDWSVQGSPSPLLGAWGSVFWASQPEGGGPVRVYVSSPGRVLLDAHRAVLGLAPPPPSDRGPVLDFFDPSAESIVLSWTQGLIAGVAARLESAGQPLPPVARPADGAAIPAAWLLAIVWATYHPDTTPLATLYSARTSTLPRVGSTLRAMYAARATTVFRADALDTRIRAVFTGAYAPPPPTMTPPTTPPTMTPPTPPTTPAREGMSPGAIVGLGLLLLLLLSEGER